MLSAPTPLTDVAGACDVAGFSCGEPSLDDWLKERARTSEGRSARTYVVRDGHRVVAYYCLAAGSVERDHLPRRIRHGNPDPVPVLVLGRLAVDRTFQGRGLGSDLVGHCFAQCCSVARIAGTRGLVVHPLDERAARFYRGLQFQELPGQPHAMFLSLEAIVAAMVAKPA